MVNDYDSGENERRNGGQLEWEAEGGDMRVKFMFKGINQSIITFSP
jgi:hypothetical protein